MAVIFEEALKKELKSGKLAPVYILFGEDAYLKTTYLKKISGSIAEEDDVFNFCKFVGQCDLQTVYDAAMQMPFMSERKCIILNDYDYLHCAPSELDRLLEIISLIPSDVTLIMYFDGIETDSKKGTKFKKLISAAEKAGGFAVELNHKSRAELAKMLSSGAAKRGCKLDSAAAGYLVDTAGEDINLLKNELEKLCAFAKNGAITKQTVDEVCTKTVEANIFKLSDFILACNSTSALNSLDELFFLRIEPMSVFYTVAGVFTDMYRVYCARLAGVPISEISKRFGYRGREFLLEKAGRNLQKFDFKRLKLCLDTCVKSDKAVKTFGSDPRQVLEEMIVKLIYIIAEGETVD